MYKMVIESKALSGNTVYMFSRGVYAIIFIIRKGKNETFVREYKALLQVKPILFFQ
jgi:hypothetical protein